LRNNTNQAQDLNKDRAEAAFKKKEERLREGEQAVAEYVADGRGVQEKTARLRALRLTRDAAAKHAADPAVKKRSA